MVFCSGIRLALYAVLFCFFSFSFFVFFFFFGFLFVCFFSLGFTFNTLHDLLKVIVL